MCALTPIPKLCNMFIHEAELNMKNHADEMVGETKVCKKTGLAKGSTLAWVRSVEERAARAALCQTSMIHLPLSTCRGGRTFTKWKNCRKTS